LAHDHHPKVFQSPSVNHLAMTPVEGTSVLTLRSVALIAVVLVGTALGGWRAASMAETKPDPSTLVVNGVSYTVTHAQQIQGLSDAALGGNAHGIQSLVTDDKALISVNLVITTGDSPSPYDAGVLRIFAAGSPGSVSPIGGILAPGHLKAKTRIEGFLSFVVPRKGGRFALGTLGDSREVPLVQVDLAPADAGQHEHSSASPSATTPLPRSSSAHYGP
jgi:hypothetical protein